MDDRSQKEYRPGYRVTADGRIWSDKSQKYLTPRRDKDGYIIVSITDRGQSEIIYVHRAVAELYIPNPHNKPQVNHKDGKKWNNDCTNLEWSTQSENIRHAFDTKLNIQKSKIPIIQLSLDGIEINRFDSITEASHATGASRHYIKKCCLGTAITSGGYMWRYAE